MTEYIDREDAIAIIEEQQSAVNPLGLNHYNYTPSEKACFAALDATKNEIAAILAADVELVKHGHWIISSDGYYPYCSECYEELKDGEMSSWCPNCGAKMLGTFNSIERPYFTLQEVRDAEMLMRLLGYSGRAELERNVRRRGIWIYGPVSSNERIYATQHLDDSSFQSIADGKSYTLDEIILSRETEEE